VARLNAYLWPLRSTATWENGGPHSGYRHLADKDEAGGSSPPRPTPGPNQRKRQSALPESAGRGVGRIKNAYLVTVPRHGRVAPRLRTAPLSPTRQRERAQADHRTNRLIDLARPTLAGQLTTEPSGAPRGGCAGRCAFGSPALHLDRARQASPSGSTVDARHTAPAGPCPPSLVGWSEPGNQAKGGDTW
jgi:hypothetical protein